MSLATIVPHEDETAWQEARRPVVTATQVRDWAKGYPADRARLLIEKITGVREDLAGIKYIDWGKFREPFLQDWVLQKYAIAPVQNDLYVSADDPRWACTPDGYATVFDHTVLSELKTSKKDLAQDSGAYLESGYEDQMQWEMLVTGADECLFVYEQHNDVWEPWPEPLPPKAFWVARDDTRIEILKGHAEDLIAHLNGWREAYVAMLDKCVTDDERIAAETALIEHIRANYTTSHGLEQRWLFIVGGDRHDPAAGDPLATGDLPDELAQLAQVVLEARAEEAAAGKRKTDAWKRIQELTREHTDFKAYGGGAALSWSTTKGVRKRFDEDAARAKAPAIIRRYEEIVEKYTVEEPYESRTMTVTKQD